MELTQDKALWIYDRMVRIRAFEERVAKLFADGRIPGFVHLYAGEEAVAVGVCAHLTLDQAAGALKLVVDPEFREILGAHMVGVSASEVIAHVALAMQLEADYRDLARVAHIHPSLAELVTEAASSV